MDQLVRWLGEQLDEDERIARDSIQQATANLAGAAASSVSVWCVIERPATGTFVATSDQWDRVAEVVPTYGGAHADHIATHDPARVLREIDAKRRMVELHIPFRVDGDPWPGCNTCSWRDEMDDLRVQRPCPTLRLLALPYADRPGYCEEWRP